MFETKGLSPIGVTITSGDATSRENMIWRVPKIILVSQVQARLHDGRLKIQAKTLTDELQDPGRDERQWVLAIRCPCWEA